MEYLQAIENGALEQNENLRLLIWSKKKEYNKSEFFKSVDEAWNYSLGSSPEYDVYSSLGLRHRDLHKIRKTKEMRGGELDIFGLLGLAMEFDIQNDARARSNSSNRDDSGLWESAEEITEFLGHLPVPTTMLVHSGGGIHAYWLFKEVWLLDDASRIDAKSISMGWHKMVASRTLHKVDSTYSLDRVYRVAGTVNHKYESGIEVVLFDLHDERRHNPEDFKEWGVDLRTMARARVVVAPKSELSKKVTNLIVYSPEFAEVWHHVATRLKGKSQSEYDLSLANLCRDAGLTVEETANAIAANRHVSGAEEKPPSYFALTLGKAGFQDAPVPSSVDPSPVSDSGGGDQRSPPPGAVPPGDGPDDPREVYFQTLSQAVGLRVRSIEYIDRGEGHESFEFTIRLFSGAKVPIHQIRQLRSQTNWMNLRVMEPADQMVTRALGKTAWEDLIASVLFHAKNVTAFGDRAETSMILEVHNYLMAVRMPMMDNRGMTELTAFANSGSPFQLDRAIFFTTAGFRRWYQMNIEKLNERNLAKYLREVGFTQRRIAGRRWWTVEHDKFLKMIGEHNASEGSLKAEGREGSEGAGDGVAGPGRPPRGGPQPSPYDRDQAVDPEDGPGRGNLRPADPPN